MAAPSPITDADNPATRLAGVLATMRDVILPPTCLGCDAQVSDQGTFCGACWQSCRFIERPFCDVMGSPFAYDLGAGALSARAIASPPAFARNRSVMLYDDVAQKLVRGLKFADRTELAPWMAATMVRASDGMLERDPIVLPVPLHRWRLLSRRFNQSAELSRAIARQTGLRHEPEALKRIRPTPQQVGLRREERAANVRGAFRVSKEHAITLKGRRVVLVDDVFTTGATLEACARALKRGGAVSVECLTFARVGTGVAVTEL